MTLANTIILTTLTSGNAALYEVQPQHLNLQERFAGPAASTPMGLGEIAHAIELLGERPLLRALDVHEKTLYRWRTGRCKIPGHQRQAIRALLGDLPGTDGQWTGWKFVRGELISPGGDRFTPGLVLSLVLLRQQLSAQERELKRLRERLQIAEKALQHYTGAANEARVRA